MEADLLTRPRSCPYDLQMRFGLARTGNPDTTGKGMQMTIHSDGHEDEIDPQEAADHMATFDGRRLETMRQAARESQRSAAASFDRSADSHDAVARSYEQSARADRPDDHGWHAARHREFASEDRDIAERLRQMANAIH
jgi:hypothetical protein